VVVLGRIRTVVLNPGQKSTSEELLESGLFNLDAAAAGKIEHGPLDYPKGRSGYKR